MYFFQLTLYFGYVELRFPLAKKIQYMKFAARIKIRRFLCRIVIAKVLSNSLVKFLTQRFQYTIALKIAARNFLPRCTVFELQKSLMIL